MAGGAAAPVRARAAVPADQHRRRARVLGVRGRQPGERQHVPGSRSRDRSGGQLLLVPRLRHERPRDLQAHRLHAGPAGARAGRPRGARSWVPGRLQRGLRQLRAAARGPLPRGPDRPARAPPAGRAVLRPGRAAAARGRAGAGRLPRPGRAILARAALLRGRAWVRAGDRRRPSPRRPSDPGVSARDQERRPPATPSRASLPLPARGRALRLPRGPLPPGRRDGTRQDGPGDRGCRNHGHPRRRGARVNRLPDVAQAPVGARDRPVRRRSVRPGGWRLPRPPRAAVRRSELLQDRELRHRGS